MVNAVAQILKNKIGELPWVERYAGLVSLGVKPTYNTNLNTGAQVNTGLQAVYPLACEVAGADCWANGTYKYLVPDGEIKSLAFFIDDGGAQYRRIEGPKQNLLVFAFNLRFVCWLNLQRLGYGDRCTLASLVVPHVLAQLVGKQTAEGNFGTGDQPEEEIYQNVQVDQITQLQRTPAMFEPFTFAREGAARGLFLYPYDYFGLRLQGTFSVNKLCLPDFDFTPSDVNCLPQ